MIIEVYLKAICKTLNSNLASFYETSADVCKIVADSLTSRMQQFRNRPYKRAARSHVSYRHRSVRKRRWMVSDADAIKSCSQGAMHVHRYRAAYTAPRSRSNYNHGTRYTLDKRAWSFLCVLPSYFSFLLFSSLLSTNAVLSRERETRSACRNFRRDKTSRYKRDYVYCVSTQPPYKWK